jgi:dihydrolipoamide dehydrogenase
LRGVDLVDEIIVTYKGALQPTAIPRKLLVVGSGAIGTEFASFYAALGSNVTLVEAVERLVPAEDEDIAAFLESCLRKQGLEVLTSAEVKDLKVDESRAKVTISHAGKSERRSFEKVILAVGIVPNTEDLGLEAMGVRMERGLVVIDEYCRSSVTGVYAIGDIVEGPWLAHKASHEAIVCVEGIAGLGGHGLDRTRIPACTYSHPQIGSIGLTERAARAKGLNIAVGSFPYVANGKAIALGEPEGLTKTIYDKATGELIGAHIIGAEATELISGFSVGKTLETTATEMTQTIYPHPTLSEMLHEESLAALGRAIHY